MTTPDPVALREALAEGFGFQGNWAAVIQDAARWALDLIEEGKQIWWCEVHECTGEGRCVTAEWLDTEYSRPSPCNMVKRLLVAL